MKLDTIPLKASYGIGLQIGQQLAGSGLEGINVEAIAHGIKTALTGDQPEVNFEEIQEALTSVYAKADELRGQSSKLAAADGEAFLKDNALRPEVTVTDSGLQYEILVAGSGHIPTSNKEVKVHYHGTLIDGTVFDSSVERGQPAQFPVTGVIKGWVEALQMMPVGSKWKLYIPHELAYGERGAGGAIAPFASLIFEVELLEIM